MSIRFNIPIKSCLNPKTKTISNTWPQTILSIPQCRSCSTSSCWKRKRLWSWNCNKPKSKRKTYKNPSSKSVCVFTPRSNNSLPTRWTMKKHMTIITLHNDSESNPNKNSTKSTKSTTPKNSKPIFLKEKSPKHKSNSKIS